MAMIQLAHRQAFLSQVFDCQAAAAHDALAGEADGAMLDLVDAAKGAAAEVVERRQAGVESLCVRAVEERFVS
jgi:hypothetical protein